MSRPRAQLSSGRIRIVDDNADAQLGASAEPIVLAPTPERLPVRALRTVTRVIIGTVIVGAALYVALAVSVVAVMGSGPDHAVVVRGAFPGGMATQGSFAYVSARRYDRSLTGKIGQAFVGVPGGSTIQVVALPGAILTTGKDGQILANTHPTGFDGTPPQPKLGHAYLAVCVSGSGCTAGHLIVVPDDRIIGQVRKFAGFNGLTNPRTYRR
ncbi:hypothetical protein [Tessaracoccus sp.]